MAQKTRIENTYETDDSVKLKPIMGIRPGVYLTVFYSFFFLLFLFWLLIYHGLVNYGTVLEIKTEPTGAAVRVNGVYLGTSGTKIIMPNSIKIMSNVNIQISLPGFEPVGGTYQIPGKIFGTRFFPRVYKLEYNLQAGDPAAVLAKAASEYAAWSFGGEPTEAWQIPLVLSEAAYRIGKEDRKNKKEELNNILLAASRFTATRAAFRDITRAKFLLDNNGNAPSPVAITNSIAEILVFLSENPQSSEWLANLLPPETSVIIRQSDWYKNGQSKLEEISKQAVVIPYGFGTGNINAAGLSFTGTDDVLISVAPVPKTLFKDFLTEHPEWQDSIFDYFENETDIATGMSWYAAEAFCEWLNRQLPSSMADMEVRLPSQKEMAYAYKYGLIDTDLYWEWSSSPFTPLDFNADHNAVNAVGSPEMAIFNGVSYDPGSDKLPKPLTKASLPPDLGSPLVTFRPAISKKNLTETQRIEKDDE